MEPQVLEIAGEFALLLYTGVEANAGTAAKRPTTNRLARANTFIISFCIVVIESAVSRHLLN